MDREQARFILQSFRPDGGDAKAPDFGEALGVAAEDRELGDWLAGERAQDAVYASALAELSVPPALRANILERHGFECHRARPESEGPSGETAEVVEMDAPCAEAAAEVSPPAGRRKERLRVLKVETRADPEVVDQSADWENTGRKGWWKTTMVAASLVLGAFAAFELTSPSNSPGRASQGDIALSKLEHRAIKEVAHPGTFLLRSAHLPDHEAWLTRNQAPALDLSEIPEGILAGKAVGSRLFMMGQTKISLLCLEVEDQSVHLAVLRSEDLQSEDLEKLKNGSSECWQCPATKVAVAAWQGREQVYLLLGKMEEENLEALLGPSP